MTSSRPSAHASPQRSRLAPRARLLALVLASFGVQVAAVGPVRAQDLICDPPTLRAPLEVMPSSGAGGVRLDAPVRVIYTPEFFAISPAPTPEEVLEIYDADGALVSGVMTLAGDDTVFFRPNGGWQPDALYTGIAYGDMDLEFNFRTGALTDVAPPTVGPIRSTSSSAVGASCDVPDGGYRIDVSVPVSVDDGAAGSIEYSLYLARAEGLDAPVRVARVRNFTSDPDATVVLSFVLAREFADRAICVQLQVTDGVGNLVAGEPYCFDPVEGAHFQGLCVTSSSPTSGTGPASWVAIAFLLGIRRRRRRVSRAS